MHEAQMHEENTFITLTYNDDHLPKNGALQHVHFQKFIRALRQKTRKNIRYFMCGEYGELNGRPHYHAILFGYEFPDAYLWRNRKGRKDYRSDLLDSLWNKGHAEIGPVTQQTTQYVARYIIKKQSRDRNQADYPITDTETGEIKGRQQEYTKMSLKPGLGATWLEANLTDVFPKDICITNDKKQIPVPKYYRRLLKQSRPVQSDILARARTKKAIESEEREDQSPERIATREKIQAIKLEKLKREL